MLNRDTFFATRMFVPFVPARTKKGYKVGSIKENRHCESRWERFAMSDTYMLVEPFMLAGECRVMLVAQ